MGGWVPIGYDRKDRTLTINEDEPNGLRLARKQSGEILWKFTKAGTFEYSCLIPDHREVSCRPSMPEPCGVWGVPGGDLRRKTSRAQLRPIWFVHLEAKPRTAANNFTRLRLYRRMHGSPFAPCPKALILTTKLPPRFGLARSVALKSGEIFWIEP
jgi:hypothetical protein